MADGSSRLDQAPPYPDLDTVLEDGPDPAPYYQPAYRHTQSMEPARRSSDLGTYGMTELANARTAEAVAAVGVPDLGPAAGHLAEAKESKLHGAFDTRRDYKLVKFTEGDPENPKNWSKAYKWWCTMVVAMTCFVVAFASSVITADVNAVAEEFNVSHEAALVSITVFVVGFGVGPMIFAPLSEVLGRQLI